MTRLHIAHITLGLDIGGQEKLLVEFARHTDPARCALTFVSLSGRGRLAVRHGHFPGARRAHHRITPFCHLSTKSRTLNSSVMSVEKNTAMMTSEA